MRGDLCPYDHGSDPVVLEGIGGVLDFPPSNRVGPGNASYNPASSMPPRSNAQTLRHPLPPPRGPPQFGKF